jgi:hypothetical protein
MKKIKKNLFGIGLALAMIMGVVFSFVPQQVKAEQGGGDDFVWAYSAMHAQPNSIMYFKLLSCCNLTYDAAGDGNQSKCYKFCNEI